MVWNSLIQMAFTKRFQARMLETAARRGSSARRGFGGCRRWLIVDGCCSVDQASRWFALCSACSTGAGWGLFDSPSTSRLYVLNASSLRIGASSLTTRHQIIRFSQGERATSPRGKQGKRDGTYWRLLTLIWKCYPNCWEGASSARAGLIIDSGPKRDGV